MCCGRSQGRRVWPRRGSVAGLTWSRAVPLLSSLAPEVPRGRVMTAAVARQCADDVETLFVGCVGSLGPFVSDACVGGIECEGR